MKHPILRKLRRAVSALLATALLLLAVPFLLPPAPVAALDFSAIESKSNTWQYYFCRTVMSVALKDAYDTGVLASITAGQFFYEGGCAGAPISIIGQNHFGIKAYSNWTGKVYDDKTHELYQSYTDFVNIVGESYAKSASLWRAYDTLDEGIADHSALLHAEDKYIPVLNAKDYKEAARALLAAGYAGGSAYADNLINYIERNGFDQLDSVTTDENGVFGLIMNCSRAELDLGESIALEAAAYPAPDKAIDVTWASTRPEVASVDQNGVVTAKRQGYTLITAQYNGKEACCMVCVDTNAYLMNSNLAVFSRPDTDSNSLGRLDRGQPLKVIDAKRYTSEDGTEFYAVSASVGSGTLVSGYAKASQIYTGSQVRLSIGTPATILHLDAGENTSIPITVYAEELQGKTLVWNSSDPTVLTVDQEGNLQTLREGVSVVTVSFDGRIALAVTVYVGTDAYETLVANAAVYLRDAPTTSAKILGTIAKGQTVKLIGEPDSGWFLVLATVNGQELEGYSYSRYFNRQGEESSDDPSSSGSSSSSSPPPVSSSEPSDVSSGTSSVVTPPTPNYKTGVVNVDDALNVRDTPSASGKRVARLRNGTQVVILESVRVNSEPVYKDWYRISFTDGGQEKTGYAAAEFILLTGFSSETYPIVDDMITEIPPNTKVSAFASAFGYSVRVTHRDGTQAKETDLLCTGDTVTVLQGQTTLAVLRACVIGDVDGDGRVLTRDCFIVKSAVLGLTTLSGEFQRAACVTGGKKPTTRDYFMIKCYVLGLANL